MTGANISPFPSTKLLATNFVIDWFKPAEPKYPTKVPHDVPKVMIPVALIPKILATNMDNTRAKINPLVFAHNAKIAFAIFRFFISKFAR
ncbi:hypothetical protein GCM10027567_16430 [Spongiibacter taiwanensis]